VIDKIIPEPEGGAHRDPETAALTVKNEILIALNTLSKIPADKLVNDRIEKFAKMGYWKE